MITPALTAGAFHAELVAVADEISELHHLIALIVMTQDHHIVAENTARALNAILRCYFLLNERLFCSRFREHHLIHLTLHPGVFSSNSPAPVPSASTRPH